MTGDYFQEVSKALKEFHEWNTTPQQKPLYMLIKVEVDKDIVYNQEQAEKYEDTVAISWFYDEPGCEIAGYL